LKRFYIIAFVLFCWSIFSIYAQDLIILKNGSVIEAKVTEISSTEIRYKRFENLDGPVIVIARSDVLSIRYENNTVEIISPTISGNSQDINQSDMPASLQSGETTLLQQILNRMPAISIAGNSLKFEFNGETWIARVNGENFSAGTIQFDVTSEGGILTLSQTHIWPGAVGRTAGRVASVIPGGSAVSGVLNTAGNIAGAAGAIEMSGTVIVLEYKAGPPTTLSLVSLRNTEADNITKPKDIITDRNPRLNTVGASVGSSFGVPWFVGSVFTTYSFFPYSFFEIGLDLGGQTNLGGWKYDDVGYFLLYPYINFSGFIPFNKGGWFAGVGFGVMFSRFSLSDEIKSDDIQWLTTPALNLNTGFIFFNFFSISYTQRIRLGGIGTNGKLSIGFSWKY